MEAKPNPVWEACLRRLKETDPTVRDDFESRLFSRISEIESTIKLADRSIKAVRDKLDALEVHMTKAVGAYENLLDMLAAYYHDKGADDGNTDGEQPNSNPNQEPTEAGA